MRKWVQVVPLLLVISTLPVPAARALPDEVEILKELLLVPGVSGHEEDVRKAIERMLPAWARERAEVDAIGNLLVTIGEGTPHLLMAAHMDETGYAITNIREDGNLQVWKIGGFYDSLYQGQHVQIHTMKGALPGVVVLPSTHLQAGRGPLPSFAVGDLLIDVGTRSRAQTEALGVAKLDTVTIPKAVYHLAESRMTGRSMDDRFGCAALIALARRLSPGSQQGTLTLAWTVQEEVGLRGAAAIASRMTPDFVFPVDSYVTSDSPLENHRIGYAPLGEGPVIRALDHSNITPVSLVRNLLEFARGKKIPLQHGATGGGNDGSVFRNAHSIIVPLSIPIRYSHSAIETIDHRDLSRLVDLLEAVAEDHSWIDRGSDP